jgi:hypothetical protein
MFASNASEDADERADFTVICRWITLEHSSLQIHITDTTELKRKIKRMPL